MYCFVGDICTHISLITLQLKVLKQSRAHYCVSLGRYFLVMLAWRKFIFCFLHVKWSAAWLSVPDDLPWWHPLPIHAATVWQSVRLAVFSTMFSSLQFCSLFLTIHGRATSIYHYHFLSPCHRQSGVILPFALTRSMDRRLVISPWLPLTLDRRGLILCANVTGCYSKSLFLSVRGGGGCCGN